jgi:hypothetical protein
MSQVKIDVWFNRRNSLVLVWGLAIVSVLMLVGTAVCTDYWRAMEAPWRTAPIWARLLLEFDLTTENGIAPWFSSMFLLIVGMCAVACFFAADKQSRPWTRYGWLVLAAGFALLSLDELAEIHERVVLQLPPGGLRFYLWLSPVLLAAPCYMVVFGWIELRKSGLAFAFLLLGAICFASVPLQEEVELAGIAAYGHNWPRPILLALLEEGSELLGMTFFLLAMITYVGGAQRPIRYRAKSLTVPLSALCLGVVFAATAVCVSGALAADGPEGGRLQNWFPSALALVASCLSAISLFNEPDQKDTAFDWAVIASGLVLSATIGSGIEKLFALSRSVQAPILAVLCICAVTATVSRRSLPPRLVFLIALGLAVAAFLGTPGPIRTPFVVTISSGLVLIAWLWARSAAPLPSYRPTPTS